MIRCDVNCYDILYFEILSKSVAGYAVKRDTPNNHTGFI